MLGPAQQAAPLTPGEFAAALERIARFETAPFLAVAVSGGPDSLALTILADRWARRRGGEVCALSIDHGLRAESGEEMRRLHHWLAARSIGHVILAWNGPKPQSGIQAAARDARYRLLAGWCREHGCLHLLTAHHRDDQNETHSIRRRAGSGPDGLAGMSAVRELEDCRVLRPLLGFGRDRLAAFLDAEGQPFLTDPSNRDPVFERARLRAEKAAPAVPDVAALGRQRALREACRSRLLAHGAALHPAGFGVLDPARLRAAPSAVAGPALAALIMAVGGGGYPPRGERLVRLLGALAAGKTSPRTLGGCRFVAWRGRVLVLRELARAEHRVPLAPGACRRWDRRFAVSLARTAPAAVTVGYLGGEGARALGRDAVRGGLPRLLYPVLPAVWDARGLAVVPHIGYRRDGASSAPLRIVLHPVNSLASAGFAVV